MLFAKGLCAGLALAAALAALPQPARAGSATDGGGALNLNLNLNFTLLYPRFLRFRVGAAAAGAVNTISFTPTVLNLGNATPLAGTGGDVSGSTVTVEVVGNGGQITITPTNDGGNAGLGTGNAADGFISYAQIATTSSDPGLPAPTLSNTGGVASQALLTEGPVTQRSAQWTFTYRNQTVPSAGTYGGRVTYTASMP